MNLVLSHYQIKPVLQARRAGMTSVETSLNLGLDRTQAVIGDVLEFPSFPLARLAWSDAEKIARDENACFVLQGDSLRKIVTFSGLTQRPYSLYPTRGAPTMLVAGFPMHRIKGIDPLASAREMVRTLAPLTGALLDTATGLGYTAIEAAKGASRVITIELDPAAQDIAAQNPWSRDLFDNPKIEQRIGDSFDIVPTLDDNSFDRILHDPPTMSLAGDLYSEEFYRELYRILKHKGRLFHYVGDPGSKFGANTTRGVSARLLRAGFKIVKPAPRAFGILALK